MAYWKFTCTWDTERECMIRRLFGNHEKNIAYGKTIEVDQYARRFSELQGMSLKGQLKNKGSITIGYL